MVRILNETQKLELKRTLDDIFNKKPQITTSANGVIKVGTSSFKIPVVNKVLSNRNILSR